MDAWHRQKVRVTQGSTIRVRTNTYAVPRRLIGEYVDVHVMAEYLEVWHGAVLVERIPRLLGWTSFRGADHLSTTSLYTMLFQRLFVSSARNLIAEALAAFTKQEEQKEWPTVPDPPGFGTGSTPPPAISPGHGRLHSLTLGRQHGEFGEGGG